MSLRTRSKNKNIKIVYSCVCVCKREREREREKERERESKKKTPKRTQNWYWIRPTRERSEELKGRDRRCPGWEGIWGWVIRCISQLQGLSIEFYRFIRSIDSALTTSSKYIGSLSSSSSRLNLSDRVGLPERHLPMKTRLIWQWQQFT